VDAALLRPPSRLACAGSRLGNRGPYPLNIKIFFPRIIRLEGASAINRAEILSLLGFLRAELRKLGIRSLSVFGSVARGEASPDGDIDLLVDLEPPLTFDRYIKAKFYLEDLLGRLVDLVMPEMPKAGVRPIAEKVAIRVA
jgi:uncharacterized protein